MYCTLTQDVIFFFFILAQNQLGVLYCIVWPCIYSVLCDQQQSADIRHLDFPQHVTPLQDTSVKFFIHTVGDFYFIFRPPTNSRL